MRSRSPANSAASSPPVPALISMIVSRASSGSRGISALRSLSSAWGSSFSRRLASSAKSASSPAISRAASRSSRTRRYAVYAETMAPSSAWRRPSLRILSGLDTTSGSAICISRSRYSLSAVSAAGNCSSAMSILMSDPCVRWRPPGRGGACCWARPAAQAGVPHIQKRQSATRCAEARRIAWTGVVEATWPSCRSASRSEPRGRRCRESSACRCRRGGTSSTRGPADYESDALTD